MVMKPPHAISAFSGFRPLRELSTPRRIQDFLGGIPINHERRGETCSSAAVSPRRGSAHCMEGALVAALALWMHGEPPLIMDLKTADNDVDHLVALVRVDALWGGETRTNKTGR